MLKQRFFTGIILLILALAFIYAQNVFLFQLSGAAVLLLAAWEWVRLTTLSARYRKIALLFMGFYLITQLLHPLATDMANNLCAVVAAWWLLWTIYLLLERKKNTIPKLNLRFLLGAGFLILTATWLALLLIKQRQDMSYPHLLLFALSLVWVMDIGAYFAGKQFGRHKLYPAISPGKSIEGVVGGLILVMLWAVVMLPICHLSVSPAMILLCLVTACVSVAGDLFESALKRQAKVKDSSQLLPGHGGILDRVDSVLAALPIFTVGLSLLGY